MRIGDFNPMDRKFWPKEPEPGFSVKKNRWVINDVIKKHEQNIKKKNALFDELLGERVDAATTYLTGSRGAERGKSVEDYFGKTYHAHLRGEDIRNQLVQQQQRMLKSQKEKYEQKEAQKLIAKSVKAGKGLKIGRTNAKKEKKSSKSV